MKTHFEWTVKAECCTACSNGYRTADDPCIIDCYDEQSLLYSKNRTKLRLNMDIEESVSDDRLAEWSKSFYGVGAWINIIAPHWTPSEEYKNWLGNTTDFVARAHAHGLKVNELLIMQ